MNNFNDLVNVFIDLLLLTVPVIFGLTLLFLTWKIIDTWIINVGDESRVNEGKQIAIAGVIALVVMSAIWGILKLLQISLFGNVSGF